MGDVLVFPVHRCRKGNTQLQEDAIAAFEEALREYRTRNLEDEYVTPEKL